MADENDGTALSGAEQAIISGQEPPAAEQQEQQVEQISPEGEQEQQQAEGEGEGRTKHYVPVGEMQKERNRRKAIEQERDQIKQNFERLAGRLDVLQQAWQQKPAAEQPKPLPPITEAPLDHIQAQAKDLEEFKAWRAQQEEQGRVSQARQQFLGAVQSREQAFRQTAPDYDAAIAHLRADRLAEWVDAGYTPEHANHIVDGEAIAIAENAMKAGKNPAEVWYSLAKRRGYKQTQKPTGAQQIETIEKGQQAGRSLSSAAGSPPPGKLTVEALLRMDDDDFAKLTDKQFRQAFG